MRNVLLLTALILCVSGKGQTGSTQAGWQPSVPGPEAGRQLFPAKFLTFSTDVSRLGQQLTRSAPSVTLSIPGPDGTQQRFLLKPAKTMHPDLEKAFPEIRCFDLQGLDDPSAHGKADWNVFGFHAMINHPQGAYFVDPYSTLDREHYIVYARKDFEKPPGHYFEEGQLSPGIEPAFKVQGQQWLATPCSGDTIMNYRLAVACTHQYAQAATNLQNPNMVQVLSKIVLTINRVNAVFEREVALRLVLVPTTTAVIFTSAAADPFKANNNIVTLIQESQKVIDSAITTGNYDIGHTFSTSNGGLAFIGSVCTKKTKAQAASGSSSPAGDPFDIDYVAHEMGHQLGASHTFNASTGSCSGNRNSTTAVEPGSGITVMSYAGICGFNDISNHSIPYLHALSYDEIIKCTRAGGGFTCAAPEATGNKSPVVVAVSKKFVIPRGTPFVLSGFASDPDGDALTYSWEETTRGDQAANWNADARPYFRTYAPATGASRSFPSEAVIRSGNYQGTPGEYLSTKPQRLSFRFTARDNRIGGGGVCSDSTTVELSTSGPFSVTLPNGGETIWPQKQQRTVYWTVNGTDQGAVNCDFVNIYCSVDNGATYTLLVQGTANDGEAEITVPAVAESQMQCRIKVEAMGNIFFDVSDDSFIIAADTTVGTGEQAASAPLFHAWPNPAEDHIEFRTARATSSALELLVVDVSGRVVKYGLFEQAQAAKGTFDISGLEAGIYIVEARCGAWRAQQRLVKQ